MPERGQPRQPRHLVPATFQQPVPATFWRRSSGRGNVARTSPEQVVGTSPEQWKIGTLPRAHRAHCVHYGPVGGGASTTKNPSAFMGMGHEQSQGVLGFSPSHQQQRFLAPLWAWGTNNHWGFLGFPLPLNNKDSQPLYGHGARIITGGSWVFPFPSTTKIPSPFMGMGHE